MKSQTRTQNRLDQSPAGTRAARLCIIALATLAPGASAFGEPQSDAAKPAKQATQQMAAQEAEGKTIGGYAVHQDIELGGRVVLNKTGSDPMWATMINQSTGMRVLNHVLLMHSINPSKTPFFDTLTSSSFGYGGDPYDVSRLSFSKGRWYDFAGSFRRDRNYFDYNLLANSLLTTYTSAAPVLVPEPSSLHLFNTVRRNTDAQLTALPLSFVSFRAGFNHATHEGPTYSSVHAGGDTQVLEWFRDSTDDFAGGVDLKLLRRTTLSYDQLFVMNRVDNTFQLTGANYKLSDGTPVSLGFDVLGGNTQCGSKAVPANGSSPGTPNTQGPELSNGVVWPYCSATIAESQTAPIRTSFPVEQLRLTSRSGTGCTSMAACSTAAAPVT